MNDSNGSKEYEAGSGKVHHTDHITATDSLDSPRAKPTFGQKAKRHCARWWWLHLLIFCAIFLIIALPLVFVGFPHIAQKGVDDSRLEVTEMRYMDPTPDSMVVTLKAVLHNPTIFTPSLDAFNADLHLITNGTYNEVAMVSLPMPNIHVLKPTSEAVVDAKVAQILNSAELAKFATEVISNENVTTTLVGRTKLHLGKLPSTSVNYNATTTYKGLNGLKGFNCTGLRLNLTAPAGTPNLRGFAFIPNPSVITVAMGNVTLSLSAKAGFIGNATIENFTLVPGNNSLAMTALVNQTRVISSLDTKGFVNMTITGISSVYNDKHLTYYETALKSNVLYLQMNVAQILADSAHA
jgi:hypothetical protein